MVTFHYSLWPFPLWLNPISTLDTFVVQRLALCQYGCLLLSAILEDAV